MDRWYSTRSVDGIAACALVLLAAAATVTISIRDPLAVWGYEIASFLLAAAAVWRLKHVGRSMVLPVALPIAVISLWGAVQLAFGETAYRYATLDAGLRFAAFGATAVAALAAFSRARSRDLLLELFAKFGFAVAVVGVVSHYTSPGKILWIFPSPYPDTWGVFLSRNNFAQFLELALPVALWRARRGAIAEVAMAAAMLAPGLASASRAGAILLAGETVACGWLLRRALPRTTQWKVAAAGAILVGAFTAIAGAGELWGRLRSADPLEVRREVERATLAMIRDRPGFGFGLGTFATVYPGYAEFDAGATVDHAHNDWLEWASEGGLAFAAAWAVLAIALWGPAVRSVWGIGVIGVFLHAVVDYPFARFGITSWFFVLAGALAAVETAREKSRARNPLSRERKAANSVTKDMVPSRRSAMIMAAMVTLIGAVTGATIAAVLTLAPGSMVRAAPPVIGTVVAKGAFRLDNATVRGNATLFEGASIETAGETAGETAAPALGAATAVVMELTSGPRVTLVAGSKGRFFGDHVVLEKGIGKIEKAQGLKFEARGLIIQPETGNASARIALAGAARVDVSALAGSFRVLNSRGILVADLNSGRTIEFEPQAPNAPSKLSGCVVFRGGHYLLTDETTNVVVELAGPGLEKEKGNRVEVTGGMDPTATPVSDASELIRTTAVKRLSKGCAATAAAGAGGPAGAAGPVKAGGGGGAGGLSTTTIAIIGGVAAAGVVGGLAVAGALPGQGSTVSR